jgi:hypothetical protein
MTRRGGRLAGIVCGFLLAALAVMPARADEYPEKFRQALEAAKKQDPAGVIKIYGKEADKEGGRNKLLCLYELASMYQIMGEWQKSAETFEKARSVEDQYDLRATASAGGAGHQVGAVLTNDRALIYYGSDYERVMCHTLDAVNYLAQADVENAAVEIRKAEEYQKKCAERAELAVEKAQAKQGGEPQGTDEEKKNEAQAEKIMQDSPALSQAFAPMNNFTSGIANSYQNAFTYYLSGIVYEAQGDAQGFDDAVHSLKTAYDLAPNAPAIRAAYLYNMKRFDSNGYKALSAQLHETVPNLPTAEFGTLVVLYEAGLVPEREEVKVDLPIGGTLVSFAFPIYSKLETVEHELSVSAGGQSATTVRVLDMRPLVVKALVEQRKGIVTRSIIRAITKSAATEELGKQTGIFGRIAGMIYTAATNRADLRSWYSLPAEVSAARLYLQPGETEVALSINGASYNEKVNIQPGAITLITVRGIEGNAHVMQANLGKKSVAPATSGTVQAQRAAPMSPQQASPPAEAAQTVAPEPAQQATPRAAQAQPAAPEPLQPSANGGGVPLQDYAASVPGKYIRRGKSADYIVLYPDGTFALLQNEKIVAGKYSVQGDAITWTAPWIANGQSGARIIKKTIKDDDGSVWDKEAESRKAAPKTPPGKEASPVPPKQATSPRTQG